MTDPDYYEWQHKIELLRREIVAASAEEGLTKAEAHAEATKRIHRLIDSGDLKPPIDAAIRAALEDADRKDSRNSEKILDRIFDGEDLLDFDIPNGLDVVVALGDEVQKGLRKTLGNMGAADHIAQDKLKADNVRRVNEKYAADRPKFAYRLTLLQKHGTYFDVFESGDFKSGDLDA